MARTRSRAHIPTDEFDARAHTRRKKRDEEQRRGKTWKRDRPNAKAELRKEYLR